MTATMRDAPPIESPAAALRIFVLRAPSTSQDAWEKFAHGCFALIEPHLQERVTVDFATLGGDVHTAFLTQLTAGSGGDILVALCHGSTDALWMPVDRRYIHDEHHALLRGKFVYLVTCSAGAVFGPAVAKEGALGYIGFSDKIFAIPLWRQAEQRKAFMAGLIAYLKGEPIPKAAAALKKALRSTAEKVAHSRKDPIKDAHVIGHLFMCEKLVTSGVGRAA